MLLRAMSPQVLAVDELGGVEDFEAVEQAVYSGCHVIGTVHAANVGELCEKPYLSDWVSKGIFQRYVGIQKDNGMRKYEIYDAQMERIC